MKKLFDFIKIIPDVLTDEQTNQIVYDLEKFNYWKPALLGDNINNNQDNYIRNCDICCISQYQEFANLDAIVFNAAKFAAQQYDMGINVSSDSGYDALRYKENGFYVTHTDASPNNNRSVSCSFSLNDDYEGGEWGFWGDEIKFKAPKGSAVLFPSNFMYPHQIFPVTKGIRYSIVTWFV